MISSAEAAAELLRRRLAASDFTAYCEYVRPEEHHLGAHHRLLCQALDDVHSGAIRRLMVMMPPGSAKSTYGSVYFPAYFLGRDPRMSVIGASHTGELADAFGRRVRNEVASQRHRLLFGSGVADDNRAAGRWSTDQGGEYNAVGVGGSITGRRGDLGIIDDPVKSREAADSETQRENTWQWYVNDYLTRLKPGGRTVLIMTRWHEDDLAGRLLEREPNDWVTIKLPMIAMEGDQLGREKGQLLWPEWFTDEMVEIAQRDPRSWISLYQQEPRPTEGAEFKRAWIQRYKTAPRVSNKILLVDPAGGEHLNRGDFTSMWVVALGADDNAYVIDGRRERMNLTQRIDTLFDLHRKHKPAQTRYERYGMQADIPAIRAEMERRQYRFSITEVAGRVQKEARIRRLIPWFQNGRMWLPESMKQVDESGQEKDLIDTFIDHEYTTFPVGKHDDMLDCLARLDEPSLTLPWPSKQSAPVEVSQFVPFDPMMGT